jgi:hypothetical protein
VKFRSSAHVSKLSVLVKGEKKGRDTTLYVVSVFSLYIAGFISWYPASIKNCALLSTQNCRDLAN